MPPEASIPGFWAQVLQGSPVAILLLGCYVLIRYVQQLHKIIDKKDEQLMTVIATSQSAMVAQTHATSAMRELLADRGLIPSKETTS